MMDLVKTTVAVLVESVSGLGSTADGLAALDGLRSSSVFPVVLSNILVGDGLMYGDCLGEHEKAAISDCRVRQVAGLLLKQVVKCAPSIHDVEEQLLRSLCDELSSIRNAAAGCISSMLSSESLSIWPTLAEKLQLMVDHGAEATCIGVTKCVALVCEDNAHELVLAQFLPVQEALFRTICALIDHENHEVRLNCFAAVRDVMRVVFAGDEQDDIDGGNYRYSDLGGSDDEDEEKVADSASRQNIDLLASIVSPRLVDAFASVVSDTSSNGEHFRRVLLECSMAMLSQWRHLTPLLPALLPLVVQTMKNACGNGDVSATLATEFIADIAQGIELGAHDVIVDNLHAILEGLLAAVTLDDFTISFFNLGNDCDEPDDEPNVNILAGRFDESTAGDTDDDEAGAHAGEGDADESDISGGGLRPQAKWCLNCLSVAVPDELLGAVSDVFGFVVAADDGDARGWIRREAALTMLAELVDELFSSVPSEGILAVAQTCEKMISSAPCSLLRAAALRCLAHMLNGQISSAMDENDDDDEHDTQGGHATSLDPFVSFGVITGALRDGNKYVQRVALELVTTNLEAAFLGCGELSASSDISDRLALFGLSAEGLESLLGDLMANFSRYQLQSRVLSLSLFGLLTANDEVHGAVGRHIAELMALIANHWDSLPHLCYENAAVMNCLCDILEAVDVDVVLQAMQGVTTRCKTLCSVARESSGSNAAAADIASLALDTVSTICDRCGAACVDILDDEMMDHVAFFVATYSPSEFQATRAALAVLGDFAQVCAQRDDRLGQLAPVVFPLLAGVCSALHELPGRLRGNAMFAVAQWIHLAITSPGAVQCDARSAAQIAETVAAIAHDLFSAPALPRSVFCMNTVFAALTITSQGVGALQSEDQHRLFVAAATLFDQIDDEDELVLNIRMFCTSVVASLTSNYIPCDEAIVRAVVSCADLAIRNVDIAHALHEQLKELMGAIAAEVGVDNVLSTMTAAQRRLLRPRYLPQ